MTESEYRKCRAGDWVVTTDTLSNSLVEVPPGSKMEIIYKRSGLDLIGVACEHCGVRARVTRVDRLLVRLV